MGGPRFVEREKAVALAQYIGLIMLGFGFAAGFAVGLGVSFIYLIVN